MEFIKIICNASTGGPQKINFLANVPRNGRTDRKAKNWKLRSKRPISILILIVDSTSRTEAYRALNKTMDILVNKLNFVDFKGHHPVAEPTMNNALALLMGLRPEDILKQYKFSRRDFWDNVPFIWDIFNQMDFITGYFEDLPMYGTFNYGGQKGFLRRPTDLTLRPIMLALNAQFPYKKKNFCFGQRAVTKFMLDHQFEAMQRFRDTPTFFVSWPVWPQHDVPHSLYTQDDNYAEFFEKISKDEDLLENTLFVFSADHAFKWDEYANTKFGLLERRTVPLLIRVPNRLQREFPQVVDNLLWNSEIVTCHYDIYRTLLHLVKHFDESGLLEGQGSEKYGWSLLEKLPRTRSCKEASVIPTMCSCNLPLLEDDTKFLFPNHSHNPELLIDSHEFPRFG
ncbi:unnamed protein product [Allacma fusca]|uniref:Uncharacterized protein n=1 Tax=Allacma fusca TaxID=39272 RepID=A0A8J2LHT2_9HEXA|nr:unnamed protein product [Allacma fusca]